MEAVCRAVEVSKEYEAGVLKVLALERVTLEITEGEFTSIAGPSGSGKTTLLNLLGLLDTPTSGEILIRGTKVSGMKWKELAYLRRQHIGFIFQSFNLIPVLTALENVELPLLLLGRKNSSELSRAILEEVGLSGLENRKPAELSGGQQQRVAIARALVKNPALVLADEPTANLDSRTAREILDLMLELNRSRGTTFIFSTHDRLVMEYARRLIFLRDGRIFEDKRITESQATARDTSLKTGGGTL